MQIWLMIKFKEDKFSKMLVFVRRLLSPFHSKTLYTRTVIWPAVSVAFAKLRKATMSFVMSVRRPVGSHWKGFRLIWHLKVFRKSV